VCNGKSGVSTEFAETNPFESHPAGRGSMLRVTASDAKEHRGLGRLSAKIGRPTGSFGLGSHGEGSRNEAAKLLHVFSV
jgi:hypothetical protein